MWRKEPGGPCVALYPAEIEFRGATYLGRKAPDQGFIVWDAGSYEVVGPDEVKISTATDAIVSYRAVFSGNALTLIDHEGCEVSYRRST